MFGPLAHSVEQLPLKQRVGGSNPPRLIFYFLSSILDAGII